MASPLEVQLILCDAAQAEARTGKVHMLGAGWSVTSSPTQHAVALLIKVPWDRANQKLKLSLQLRDGDGKPVELSTDQGPASVQAEGDIEVGRPPGLAPGSMLDASFALNVPPLPLSPGRYEWHLDLAEKTESAFFTVR
ncbi:DUF6941 family protein [Micromonospora maris]|uniref:DUF6941 family protein n=1 Tax=Micromonospora maris TaxID=1003110 RepID=UPI0011D21F51|nr:hypothetical protein [Micromonospora maris]